MLDESSKPNIKYIRGRTTTPTTGRTTTPTFAMIPAEVLFDQRLRHEDLHTYAVMVYFRDNAKVNTGQRRLSGACSMDRRTFRRILNRLIEFGHIEVEPRRIGPKQATYRLLSPLFAGKSAGEIDSQTVDSNELSDKIGQLRAPDKICPECHKKRRGLMSLGWCRSCNSTKKMEKISEKTVRRVLKEQKTA